MVTRTAPRAGKRGARVSGAGGRTGGSGRRVPPASVAADEATRSGGVTNEMSAVEAGAPLPSKIRFECEKYPSLRVLVASEDVGEVTVNRYAEFSGGLLDVDGGDAPALAAVRRVMLGNGIAEVGDPADYEDTLSKLTCGRCGLVSKNEKGAEAHAKLHLVEDAAAVLRESTEED